MPPKSRNQATTQSHAVQITRWRYLLRNPDFQKDMDALNGALKGNGLQFDEERERIADKWGLLRIPGEAIAYWPGGRPHLDDFKALEKYGSEDLVSHSPVAATELRENRFLFLRVDLNHPANVLLPLIEEELRYQIRPRRRRRHRLDKLDFHLEVFDLAVEDLPFSEIANKVHSDVSTVKRAYLTATEKIFGDTNRPKKKDLSLEYLKNFDPESHWRNCATCKNAKRADQMCRDARRYSDQDRGSQRELGGYDTTR